MQFLQAQQDLVIRVSQAYFDVLTAQDNVELFQSKKALIKQQLQAAQSKFEVGSATIVDANDAQARFDIANAQETAAQAEKSSASALASSQLGFDVYTLINLDVLITLNALFTTRATLYKARYDNILNALRLKA